MLELQNEKLRFSFPEVWPGAALEVGFQRTLRIPDNRKTYPLPPGLGFFPLRHVEDFSGRLPEAWKNHGGVMLPMYQAEALWVHFRGSYLEDRGVEYPFAVKIATGKVNAVTGAEWKNKLCGMPQDYLVYPAQPWLDGYCVEKGVIRQFVAMPLGAGYTAEEQLTGEAEFGGLQVMVHPMKREVFARRFPKRAREFMVGKMSADRACFSAPAMGLAPGGRMKQEIYEDEFGVDDWDLEQGSRCFVHIANSVLWEEITGERPPTQPPSAREYSTHGLPWFNYYDESAKAVGGSSVLSQLKSVLTLGDLKKQSPLPENESCDIKKVEELSPKGKMKQGEW